VAVGAVKAQDVEDDNAFGRVDDLTDAEERFAPGDSEKFGCARIGDSGVDFFVGVAEFDAVVAFYRGEKRRGLQRRGEQAGKLSGGEVAGLKGERFASCGAKPLEFEDAAFGRERKASSGFFFVVNNLGEQDLGDR